MNKKKFFKTNGYWIERDFFKKSDMKDIFNLFYDVSFAMALRHNLINNKDKFKSPKLLKYPKNIKDLDKIILKIFNFNKDLVGEIYDTVSYSSTFLRFISSKKIEKLTKKLLGMSKISTLYGTAGRIRIDLPRDERRTYGWHQEVFYTIPKSQYLQTWCPIIRDANYKNGTIEICKKSHLEKIAKQNWKDIKGRATQIIVDKKMVKKYKKKVIAIKAGDLMFFDGHLFHRSGHNQTKSDIRFSMIGMWHNVNSKNFRAHKPNFINREMSSKQYYKSYFDK